jgi:hypothetical protein
MPMDVATLFDPASLGERQKRAAETWALVAQRYLEGINDIAARSLLMQSAVLQQAIASVFGWARATSPIGHAAKDDEGASAAMEAAVDSIRDVMTAACKCGMDVMSAIRDGSGVNPTSRSMACNVPEVTRKSPSQRKR